MNTQPYRTPPQTLNPNPQSQQFCPTNAAFLEFAKEELNLKSADQLLAAAGKSPDLFKRLLAFHVTKGVLTADKLKSGQRLPTLAAGAPALTVFKDKRGAIEILHPEVDDGHDHDEEEEEGAHDGHEEHEGGAFAVDCLSVELLLGHLDCHLRAQSQRRRSSLSINTCRAIIYTLPHDTSPSAPALLPPFARNLPHPAQSTPTRSSAPT